MRKTIIIVFVLVSIMGCGGKKSSPAGRLQQPTGQFSYVTPDGWYRTKLVGVSFVIVSTEPDAGARPNVFVEFVESASNVKTVVAGVVGANAKNSNSYAVTGQVEFVTASGLVGQKISAGRKNKENVQIAIFHYVLQDKERVMVITCICAEVVKEKYGPIFDAAMKSVQSEVVE